MTESSGGGELGIGLSDINNAKKRLRNTNGLSQQIEFNQKQLRLRVIAGFFTLFIMSTLLSWMVGMPNFLKYGITALTLTSLFIYLVVYLRDKAKLSKQREQQLNSYRDKQATR